jgi:hypothetical protein
MPIAAAGRGPYRYEYRLRVRNAGSEVGRESKPAFAHVARDQVGETGLKDGTFAAFERSDPLRVPVDANDHMAKVCKAGARDQADIAAADHCDVH